MAQPNNNQAAFWEAMKEKYEMRNESLRQQEICLRRRLEQLKELMEKQKAGDDCDCFPEKLEKPSLVQCLVEKGKNLILGSCKCGDAKTGEELLCACHITDPTIPLNIDPKCPVIDTGSPIKDPRNLIKDPANPSTSEGCPNTTCDFYNPELVRIADNPSTFSLKTTDLYYMNKLAELVKTEKSMQDKIEDLENREQSYITAYKDLQDALDKKAKNDPMRNEFNRMVEGMEAENKKLKNELEDVRLEMKHCFERVEGPLKRKLDDQTDKCLKMESEMRCLQNQMQAKEDNYLRELSEMKAKLCQACCTMMDLNDVNSKLKDTLTSAQDKYGILEDELLKQQLKEAENILKFKNALSRRCPNADTLNRGDDSEQDLSHMARKLSETLKEVCPCVTSVPSGLTETVQNIKQLTELVGEKGAQQKKRRKGKSGKNEPCSCLFNRETKTSAEKIDRDNCSSLRLKPIMYSKIARPGKNIARSVSEASCSCSVSLADVSPPPPARKSCQSEIASQTPPITDITEPITKPITEPITEPIPEPITEPIPEPIAEPITEPIPEPITEPIPEPITESIPEPIAEPIAEPITELITEPVTEPIAEAVKNAVPEGSLCECCPRQDACTITKQPSKISNPKLSDPKIPDPEIPDPEIPDPVMLDAKIPDHIESLETVCSCDEQQSKKTGPSEEVLAVKNLGSMSAARKKSRKEKMKIDTTYDILNAPPDDIHVITTIANTGSLEITTEGPPGIIETRVNCLPDGKIEVVTKLIDYKNIGSFLDGTLLHTTNSKNSPSNDTDCNRSKTCGGQCDENQVSNGLNEEVDPSSAEGKFIVNNNYILFNTNETNRLKSAEWKNNNFDYKNSEESEIDTFTAKTSRRVLDDTAVSSQDYREVFKLSSRPSLTDVEKYLQDRNEVESLQSSSSFIYPEPLYTISEVDEEADSAATDMEDTFRDEIVNRYDSIKFEGNNKNNAGNPAMEVDESLSGNNVVDNLIEKEPLVIITECGDGPSYLPCQKEEADPLYKQETVVPTDLDSIDQNKTETCTNGDYFDNSESRTMINANLENSSPSDHSLSLGSFLASQDNESREVYEHSWCRVVLDEKSLRDLSIYPSPYQIFDETLCLQVQSSRSLCKLYRNFGDINLLRENFHLKQSKSMYERRGNNAKCLRVCKSAEMALGSLKINLESIKFSSESPTSAGDYDGKNKDSRKKGLEDVLLASCATENGCNDLEARQMISDRTFQCFVCSCANKDEKKNAEANTNTDTSDNLEQRIDRLLKVNPLMTHKAKCNRKVCRCSRKLLHHANEEAPPLKKSKRDVKKEKHLRPETLPVLRSTNGSPQYQGDSPQHGENCTCVDCICNPSNFKKSMKAKCNSNTCKRLKISGIPSDNKETFKFPPADITVMSLRIPCDCGENCPCNPCADTSKKTKPQSKQDAIASRAKQVDVACGCGPSPVSAKSSAIIPCPNVPVNNAETWKNVARSSCGPSPGEKKEVCDCKVCECRPCGYPEKGRTPCDCKVPKKEDQPKGTCTCTCTCIPYEPELSTKPLIDNNGPEIVGDTLIEYESSGINPNSAVTCDCDPCECIICSSPKATTRADDNDSPQLPDSVTNLPIHKEICYCGNCACNPCKVQEEIGDVSPDDDRQIRNTKCDCTKCECLVCFDEGNKNDNINLKNEITVMLNDVHEETNKFDKIVACNCTKCECENCGVDITYFKSNQAVPNQTDLSEPSQAALNDSQEQLLVTRKDQGRNVPSPEQNQKSGRGEDSKKELICNCKSCRCHPCLDPNITPTTIGDTASAKKEIMNVLNKIGCTCDEAEDNLKPLVKRASKFESTISKMKLTLNNLQQKCKDKDQIIKAMTNDLRLRSNSGVFAELFTELAHPKNEYVPDFTRTTVADNLPNPKQIAPSRYPHHRKSSAGRFDNRLEPILELDRYLPDTSGDSCNCRRKLDVSKMEIVDIRRVTLDSILIKWRSPTNISGITGYQIFVNEELKYKVLSPNRTNAVLDSLDLSHSLEIMLFAMNFSKRCEPPALASYKL